MKLIAHRGLFEGPDKDLENNPNQIKTALSLGYDCEVDLWIVDNDFYLGHDYPQYHVTEDFVKTNGLWIHAKNLAALRWLTDANLVYFWHENDKFTLTSNNYIWSFPEQELTDRSVMLMPEWKDPEFKSLNLNCFAICSDYVRKIQSLII